MDTLSSALVAAQQSRSAKPYVYGVLQDYEGAAARLRFDRVYTGSEPVDSAAAVVAGDGSLIRARVDVGVVYVSRVTTPGSGSTFSSWTNLGAISSATGTVALAAEGSNVYLFYVHTDDVTIRMRVSSDNGATFGSASDVATAATLARYLAADANPDGDVVLIFTDTSDVYATRYTGTWSTPGLWGDSAFSVSGLACYWRFDFQVVVTGKEVTTEDSKVWTLLYGDGVLLGADTWGDALAIETAFNLSDVTFYSPSLQLSGGAYRLYYVELYTGDAAHRRVMHTWLDTSLNMTADRWREPAPLDYAPTTNDGLAATLSFDDGLAWLVAADGVWLATIGGIADLEVTDDIVAAAVNTDHLNGKVRLELRNDDGRYNAAAAVARGMRLNLVAGYVTTSGPELPAASRWYWVEEIEYLTGSRPRVVLHARDGWHLLERWHAKRQQTWAPGDSTLLGIMGHVLGRAGLTISSVDASTVLQGWEPGITINPGESGRNVMRRLLSSVADEIRFQTAAAIVVEPEVGDATDYALGVDHAILEATYREVGPGFNRARVVGFDSYAEALDQGDIEAVGERASVPIIDLNLFDDTLSLGRAAIALRDEQIRARRDELVLFGVHCGVELWDVVAVTDPQRGLAAATRRVLAFGWRYEPFKGGDYEMSVVLGNV